MSPKRAGLSEPHAARSPRPGLRERGSLCAPGSSLLAVRSPRPLPVQAETVSPASRKPRGPRGRAPPHPGRGSSSVCLGRAAARSPGAASGATAHRSSPGCSAHSPRSRVFPALDGSDHVVILERCWEHSLFWVCFMHILCRVFFFFLSSVVFSLPASSPAWWNHAVLRLFLLAFRLLSRSGVSAEAEGGACSALDPGPHP